MLNAIIVPQVFYEAFFKFELFEDEPYDQP